MLEIGGLPIIAYNLSMLAAGGFRDVVINLHHLPDVVREYVGTGARWGLRVTYSEEPNLLGTGGALLPCIDRFRRETFAIVFGDNVIEIDLRSMLAAHRARSAAATIAVWQRDDPSQSGVAEFGDDDRIVRFIEKPAPGQTESHWINAGVVLAEPVLLEEVPPGRPSDLGRDIFPRALARGLGVYAYRLDGGLWWFDRVEDYRAALIDPRLDAFVKRSSAVHES
jgi:NDP-sugar pyrophosphorylase family protein